MIAREVAKQIIKENTGKEPTDGQITKAEILIVEFARAYANALKPILSAECAMPDVGQRFSQLPKDYKRYAELSFKYRQEGCTEDEDEEHWDLRVKLGL